MSNRIQKRESNFTQVSNSFLRDSNISFKAKGLFCYMFSMSEDWNFTLKSIATQQNDGLASIISAMKELKEVGYVIYTKHTDGTGTYFLDDEPKVENPNVEKPNLGNPKLGKSTRIKKTQLDKNTNDKKNNNKSFDLIELVDEILNESNNLNLKVNYVSFREWIAFRKDIKKPLTKISAKKQLLLLTKYSAEIQREIIDASIMNGYQGLFEPKQNNFNNQAMSKREKSNQMVDEVFAELEREKNSHCDYEGEVYEC